MSLRSAKYVNNNTEAHVKEPNKEHDKDHPGETSEGRHGRDQGKEAHQPRGAVPRLQRPPVRASKAHRKEARRSAIKTSLCCGASTVRQWSRRKSWYPWVTRRSALMRRGSGPAVLLCHRPGGTGSTLQVNTRCRWPRARGHGCRDKPAKNGENPATGETLG
jgi:hypothetical protein